jgi:undecaprenyl-diphosphatase
MLGFGVVLYVVDRSCLTVRRIEHMRWGGALAIGLAQVLALVPGTSRAGITMTAARALGYERTEAARFSMLLSIPVIAAAGVLEGFELWRAGDAELTLSVALAVAMAFGAALAAIGLLMRWLTRASFTPFVVYRVALGAALLWLAYT